MTFYQHRFASVQDYLHHRAPYLLVDQIADIADREITTTAKVTGDEGFIRGHFPGAPVLPGAMMQEMTTQSAGILIAANYNPMQEYNTHDPDFNEFALGVLVRVTSARYRGFAKPGDELTIRVRLDDQIDHVFDFNASVSIADQRIMNNRFRLTNIPSDTLKS